MKTGGVSVGEEDHIKNAVAECGHIDLWRIAIKPGKPLAFGHVNNTPFFGLPGNPVSTFITFLLFARPFLLKQQGQTRFDIQPTKMVANFDHKMNPKREEFVRVKVENGQLIKFNNQSSGVLSSMSWADGMARIPAGESVAMGDTLCYLPFNDFFK